MSESESPAHCSYQGCTRPVHGDTDKCIFHAPADKKDPQEFRNALAAQIRQWRNEIASVWDFRGWVFVDVERKTNPQRSWDKYNMFRRAVFPAFVSFVGAKFESEACFISSKFAGDAYFTSARFTRVANFASAQFTGDASFWSVQFAEYASFWSAQFTTDVGFRDATFLSTADFDLTTFERACFTHATFRGPVSFRGVKFLETDLSYAVFAVEGHMECANLSRRAVVRWPGPGKRYDQHGNEMKRGTLRLCVPKQSSKRGFVDLRGNVLNDDTTLVERPT